MQSELITKATDFFATEDVVKFAYLFGSLARNDAGPLSDLDLAVYLDDRVNGFHRRLLMMESLAKRLGTEKFDLIVLNRAPVLLRYEVIKEGIILKEDRQLRVPFETRVLREYLDTAHLREVQLMYLKEQLRGGAGHDG